MDIYMYIEARNKIYQVENMSLIQSNVTSRSSLTDQEHVVCDGQRQQEAPGRRLPDARRQHEHQERQRVEEEPERQQHAQRVKLDVDAQSMHVPDDVTVVAQCCRQVRCVGVVQPLRGVIQW